MHEHIQSIISHEPKTNIISIPSILSSWAWSKNLFDHYTSPKTFTSLLELSFEIVLASFGNDENNSTGIDFRFNWKVIKIIVKKKRKESIERIVFLAWTGGRLMVSASDLEMQRREGSTVARTPPVSTHFASSEPFQSARFLQGSLQNSPFHSSISGLHQAEIIIQQFFSSSTRLAPPAPPAALVLLSLVLPLAGTHLLNNSLAPWRIWTFWATVESMTGISETLIVLSW